MEYKQFSVEIFRNVNNSGYERNTGVYGGTAVCCSFMYVPINFSMIFIRVFLGLSAKNNPKKHMGKDKQRRMKQK